MPEHTPVPTPHRAIYGFALSMFFLVLFVWYLIWAFVPASILKQHLGLNFAPDKYFVMFIPVVIMFALTIFGFIIYPAMNLAITFDPDDERTLRDNFSISRCKWVDATNGRLCDKRVDRPTGSDWTVNKWCSVHDPLQESGNRMTDDDKKIDNYCDCTDLEHCLLAKQPDHVKQLLERRTVPSICDLDISDVCAELFGRGPQ